MNSTALQLTKMVLGFAGGLICLLFVALQKKVGYDIDPSIEMALILSGLAGMGIGYHGAYKIDPKDPGAPSPPV